MGLPANPVDPFRRVARTALAIGAAGSLALMTYAGRHNPSIVLIVLLKIEISPETEVTTPALCDDDPP